MATEAAKRAAIVAARSFGDRVIGNNRQIDGWIDHLATIIDRETHLPESVVALKECHRRLSSLTKLIGDVPQDRLIYESIEIARKAIALIEKNEAVGA